MYLKDQAKKMYNHPSFKYKMFYFEHKTYDDKADIPHIHIDGRRLNVFATNFAYGGEALRCQLDDDFIMEVIICFQPNDWGKQDEHEAKLIEMGVDELLQNMYYETDESNELGDYELDFLNIEA